MNCRGLSMLDPDELDIHESWEGSVGYPHMDREVEGELPDLPFPPEPTGFLPGSQEKLDIIQWRYEHGYCGWHPLDARGRSDEARYDVPGIRIVGDMFVVHTSRRVGGKERWFRRHFTILEEAVDWLAELDEKYPPQRKRR